MKKEKLNINLPKNNENFLWKYFDLHRFIYLITEQKLFFTRLDKLEDPYEGVATKLFRREAKYSTIPLDINEFNDKTPKSKRKQLINEKIFFDYLKNKETEKSQKCQYTNCWFAGDRESMAMWNIYSNPDSVAIKADFNLLKVELSKSFSNLISENGNRLTVIGENIKYLKLNPFDPKLPKQNLVYSALKKDVSYEYENEYRFLIVTIESLDKHEQFYTVPIDINKIGLTVFTHPNMEDWKFINIKKLLDLTNCKINFEKAATLLRNKN